jgi:hypothetical protein
MYYVYVDWTTDGDVYPFYVGKGTLNLTTKKYRNTFHHNISQLHGFRREIVLGPVDNDTAVKEEIRLIAEFNTFNGDNPRGANFTRGGEGTPGRKVHMTPEWREKISRSLKGKASTLEANAKRSTSQLGRKKSRQKQWTDEERDRIYGPRRGKDVVPPESRTRQAEKLRGRKRAPFSEEHRRKLSEALKGRKLSEEHKEHLRKAAQK